MFLILEKLGVCVYFVIIVDFDLLSKGKFDFEIFLVVVDSIGVLL